MEGDAKRFPLVRTKWSNEKAMASLFALLVAWQLPSWVMGNADRAGRFAALVAAALLVDAVCNLARYHRLLCSVSAAVTAAVAWILAPVCAPAAPYPLILAAVILSLALGKHVAGGTGKNLWNPAMLALAAMALVSRVPFVTASFVTLPVAGYAASLADDALLWPLVVACACIPFLAFRPFAGGFFALGSAIPAIAVMVGAGVFAQALGQSIESVAALSLFLASVAMTDPVTVTARPVSGAALGALAGAISCASLIGIGFLSPGAVPFIILAVNALSFAVDRFLPRERAQSLVHARGIGRRSKPIIAAGHEAAGHEAAGQEAAVAHDAPEVALSLAGLSPDVILSAIRDSGIVGLGGAGFPTAVKIETFRASPAPRKALIVNAVECDPGLAHDKWLLANRGADIAEAFALVMFACGCEEAFLAVKRGTPVSPDLIARLPAKARLARVPNRYPVGAERILIRLVSGVMIPPDAIPAREGYLVLNVQTTLAVRDAVLASCDAVLAPCDAVHADRKPELEKHVTVADLRARESRVVRAREGEPLVAVFARAFPGAGSGALFAGGGLMQAYRAFDDDVVGPGVNFIARGNAPRYREDPQCSRCDRCAASCPAGLDVRAIADLVDAGMLARAASLGAERCLSCGSCSASCLAGKNLSHRLSIAKRASRAGALDLPENRA